MQSPSTRIRATLFWSRIACEVGIHMLKGAAEAMASLERAMVESHRGVEVSQAQAQAEAWNAGQPLNDYEPGVILQTH